MSADKRIDWPIYYRHQLWLGNIASGWVGIATLWTPKEKIVAALPAEAKARVAVVGQLYTQHGCEYIFRNIWANPKIRYLIVVGADLSQSSQPLFDRNHPLWQEFEEKLVREFFAKVAVLDWRQFQIQQLSKRLLKLKFKPPFALPQILPQVKLEVKDYPSESSVFRVEAETIGEAWLQILHLILRFGRRVPRIYLYGGFERTLLNLAVVITKEDIKNPKIYPFFDFDKEMLRNYLVNFFNPSRGKEPYTYGERLFAYQVGDKKVDQVAQMVKKLRSFPYNKGALATLWQPTIDNFPIRKPWRTPCLTLVQGFCLEDKFYLTAYFRSNDMFNAWPQNAFALRKLQAEIAYRIGKKVGDLTTISQTAFVDERDLPAARRKIENASLTFCRPDPRGNLVIEVEGSEIIVRHLSPDGSKILAEYRQDGRQPKAAWRLAQKLLKDRVISRVDHALDIGEQLGRAEDAVKLGLKFVQDQQLKK